MRKMLVLAPAAEAEIGTRRLDAMGRRLNNAQRPRVDYTFLSAKLFHLRAFAGQNAGHQNRVPLMEAQRFAAVHELDR